MSDNELIAEFIGFTKTGRSYQDNGNTFYQYCYVYMQHFDQFKYSWDWLMPVIQKIETLYSEAFPPGDEFIKRVLAHDWPIDDHYTNVIALPLSSKIDEAYKAVVEFIKWYNNQIKP